MCLQAVQGGDVTGIEHGLVIALGWTGSWRFNATRSMDGSTVRIIVTTGTLCASLAGGESLYLGSAIAVPYTGSDHRIGYQGLRRIIALYKAPRDTDSPGLLPSFLAWDTFDRWAVPKGTERNESSYRAVQSLGYAAGLDTLWVDASWFKMLPGEARYDTLTVGEWRLPLKNVEDTDAVPDGLRALLDDWRAKGKVADTPLVTKHKVAGTPLVTTYKFTNARASGRGDEPPYEPSHARLKTILWVEPERCGTAGILTKTSRKGVYIPSTLT